ncbi:hypothetical protein I308_106785 [Cryptococcus tetragattii IND107]|uniref:WD40 repeat-like protein n=1 Tax=Cryptococcus tetragattii IND107 TaxID=1296105 RepID=A0ABR3BHQ8_9TREE|nr:hypothetical protein I308_06327 [Cryptococcus tetragattii IND107]
MSGSKEVENLSYVDIQHDAVDVFDDVEQSVVMKEDIWISGYHHGETSVHGKAMVEFEDGGSINITAQNGVKVERITKTDFMVDVPTLGVSNRPVHFPKHVLHPPYKKTSDVDSPLQINALAVNPKTPHIVVGGPNGYCMILPTGVMASPEKEGVKLKGHVGDVRAVKWFPSGEVILTASADLTIRVFGINGVNPRTFKGHSRAITSLAILGVGKTVLSAAKDGSIRLWDVGSGEQVKQWLTGGEKGSLVIENLILVEESTALEALGLQGQERAMLVQDQLGVWVQPWDGQGWLVEADKQIASLAYQKRTGTIAIGYSSGIVEIRDLSSLAPGTTGKRKKIRRNESPVYCLTFGLDVEDGEMDLYLGTAAGLPCRLGVKCVADGYQVVVKDELAGWDAVGIECMEVARDGMWCGGGEGGLRRYTV